MISLKANTIPLIAAGFLAFSAPAQSSDLLDGLLDQSADQPVRTYFQGLAVGIDGGGQFTSLQINGEDGDYLDGLSSDGLIGGVHLEYLLATGRFRAGPYVEGGFSNVNTEVGAPGFDIFKQDSYYGTGIKAGITTGGSTLLFARVGYDWSQWSSDDPSSEDADFGSWVIGGGIETMISNNVSLGLGADYLIVHDVEAAGEDLSKIFDDSEMLRIKARLTWRQ